MSLVCGVFFFYFSSLEVYEIHPRALSQVLEERERKIKGEHNVHAAERSAFIYMSVCVFTIRDNDQESGSDYEPRGWHQR
jgi:predicted nuclease with RNAse H fold